MTGVKEKVFIPWNDKFCTAISNLDEHHERLFELLNSLYFGVFACEELEQESELTRQTLAELESYAKYHFIAEEKLMQEHKYPDYLAHKREHEYFAKQVNSLQEKHQKGELALSFSTFEFIKEWLTNHILQTDRNYVPFLHEKGVK